MALLTAPAAGTVVAGAARHLPPVLAPDGVGAGADGLEPGGGAPGAAGAGDAVVVGPVVPVVRPGGLLEEGRPGATRRARETSARTVVPPGHVQVAVPSSVGAGRPPRVVHAAVRAT